MTISDEDIKRLDDRYVSKQACETKNDKTQDAISRMQSDMAVMCTKLGVTNKWLGVIATAVITGLVGALIALVVK